MHKTLEGTNKKQPGASKQSTALAADNSLRQLAFDNSLQAQIISTVSSGKIIVANTAACKLLGYSKKELLTKNRAAIFDINESGFKKMLKQRTDEEHSIATVTAIKKDGNPVPCQITSAVFTDEYGIRKAITTITDMSQSILKQQKIDIIREKIVADNIILAKSNQKNIDIKKEKIVADNIVLAKSKQKNIDTKKEKIVADNIVLAISKQKDIDTKKEKIVADNIVLAISKQKDIDTKKEKIVADNIVLAISKQKDIDIKKEKIVADNIVLAISKQKDIDIKKEKIVADNIVIAKSKQKNIDNRKEKIVVDNIVLAREKSNARLVATRDRLLTECRENFKLIMNSSSDILFDIDLIANEVIISDDYEKEFGYKTANNNKIPAEDWISHIHPQDKEAVMKDYFRMLASEDSEWKYGYRFLRADDSVSNILNSSVILRNSGGIAYRMIGSMQDISKQKVLQERLEQEINLKETQIAEAREEAKETQRIDIGIELHDNINQLLAASKMYLEMAKGGGENSEMYVNRSSEYTLTAIEEIRKLTKGLTTGIELGLKGAIDDIILDIMEVHPVKISCTLDNFIESSVNDKFKLNVLRIMQEQLNNILKHAEATEAKIILWQNNDSIILTISDNGIGFNTIIKRKGIGLANIKSRAKTYNGHADLISQPGNGCVLTVTFPFSDDLSAGH